VKVGDMVRFKNLHSSWGEIGIIITIKFGDLGVGHMSMLTKAPHMCSIPWHNRDTYISEVISESR